MFRKHFIRFMFRVVASGAIATGLAGFMSSGAPYAIEACIIGFACYTFTSLTETVVTRLQKPVKQNEQSPVK